MFADDVGNTNLVIMKLDLSYYYEYKETQLTVKKMKNTMKF